MIGRKIDSWFDFRWLKEGLFWIAVVLLAFIGMAIAGIIQVERGLHKRPAPIQQAEVAR